MHRTPFHQFHVEHGAKMVDYAGWEMPIRYTSIIAEHKQVRSSGGLFDVSHMGRIKFGGRHGRKLLERILTRRVSDMDEGQCRYSLICNAHGGVIEDVLVYRYDGHWLLVVNASNRQKVLAHIEASIGDLKAKVEDLTFKTAMVAMQGPNVMDQIARFSSEVPSLKRYRFCVKNLFVVKLTISRTGYTGEDGVEVILPANMAEKAIKMMYKEPSNDEEAAAVMTPAGLGARDSLRIEAGMPLYGHELAEDIDPLTAGLNFAVDMDKGEDGPTGADERFIGQEALFAVAKAGPGRKLVGLKLDGKRTPRQGMGVLKGDQAIGHLTSGCLSPTLEAPIAMAYVAARSCGEGDSLVVDFGGKQVEAEVVPLPFYKRK